MKFKCEQCGFQTGISSVFKKHQLIHSDERPFKCDICEYRARRRDALKIHVATHSEDRPFKCDFCEYRARRRDDLKSHVATHSEDRPFKCDICEYRARRRDDLKSHVATHSEDRPFKCDFCEYRARRRDVLKNHVATHSEDRPFKCDICEYRARRRDDLKSHVATHSEDRPFKCDICEYRTQTSCNLKRHVVTHTEDRPFKCDICEYRARRRDDLKSHVATHSEDRPFKCDICEYRARRRENLKRHVATHSEDRPFKCVVCEYRARSRDDLKSHVVTHSEDRPFKCDFCEYRTQTSCNLKKHVVTHSDERPFKCNFCDFAAKLKTILRNHIARLHPSKSGIERKITKSVSIKRKNLYDQSTSKRKRASTKDNARKPNQGNIESKLSDSSEVQSESRPTDVADFVLPIKPKSNIKRGRSQLERSGPNANHDSLNEIDQSKELKIHTESDPDDPRYARESNSTLSESVGSNFNQGISLLGEFNTKSPTITSEKIKKEPEIPELSDNFSLKFDLNCVKLENETATPLPSNETIYGPNSDTSMLESNVKWEEPTDHLKYEFGFLNNDPVDQDNQSTIKQCSIILTKLEDSGNYHGCYYVKVKEPPYLYEVVKVNLNPVI